MIFSSTKNLINAASSKGTDKAVEEAAAAFLAKVEQMSPAEAAEQMAALAEHFDLPVLYRGAYLALIGGAMVEKGVDPQPMAAALRMQLQKLLEAAAKLADACRAVMPEDSADEEDDEDELDEDGERPVNEAFEEAWRQVAPKMPAEVDAWNALKTLWRPGIAVYSVSDLARLAARKVREPAKRIAEFHEAGHWLQLILSVLDDEPIVVIEPQTGLGIVGRIFGVVDNFQLHTLLMETFPSTGVFATRVPRMFADVARGIGPQEIEDGVVTGFWNLYTYRALQSNGQLPESNDFSSSSHWVWNEGLPEDIPVLDGHRVVLLGPPSIERSWRAMRMFERLPADLKIERKLSAAEVSSWQQKMLAAK
jgi:hypothetical protein